MIQKVYHFEYQTFASSEELNEDDRLLMEEARAATTKAYAPYSNFSVGAAVLLSDGSVVSGANQENASFPAGICAERVVLAAVSSLHKNADIKKMAISYFNAEGSSSDPITPCGICRQALAEYTYRSGHAIPLILSGMEGEVWIVPDTLLLLPMSFSGKDLKK
ncbi:MAG: cytidine deaminase [Bacteroidota bacterium]|jgi:cytidine deaminase